MVARGTRPATGATAAGARSARGRVVANSIPKSGTHLLLRLLTLLGYEHFEKGVRRNVGLNKFPLARRLFTERGSDTVPIGVDFPTPVNRRWLEARLGRVPEGAAVSAHCSYSPQFDALLKGKGMKVVCIVRDPRDVAVSHMHYLKKRTDHFAHEEYMALADDHERLMVSIRGGALGRHRLQSLDERYRGFLAWGKDGDACVVRFEDLVGPKGGGDERAQLQAVRNVAEHLGIERDEEELASVQQGLFGSGRTFRKGRAGGWREEFSGGHTEAIDEVAGPLLVELGYERGARGRS